MCHPCPVNAKAPMGCFPVHCCRIEFIMSSPSKKPPGWFQFLLPLILCVLFVLGLIGYRQQKVWSERTRVKFTITLAEKNVAYGASVLFDGHPVGNGDKISLGSHKLIIKHPKAEMYQTNFFAWYGERDFGRIALHRLSGRLNFQSSFPPSRLSIVGQEYTTDLSDVPTTGLEVPTDTYKIRAEYPHWSQTKTVEVTDHATADCVFEPKFGALALACNFENAAFRLLDETGNPVESGVIPATVTSLPVGAYRLLVTSQNHQLQKDATVSLNQTNTVVAEFIFGALQLETMPPGAQVRLTGGNNVGKTPLLLTQLQPQTNQFTMEMSGYETATVTVEITGGQTNHVQTNLVSLAHVSAMRSAKNYLAAGDFERAMAELNKVFQANPNDAEALNLQSEALSQQAIKQAKALAKAGDYIGADKILTAVLQALPGNAAISGLLAEYQPHEREQLDRQQSNQLKQPSKVFDSVMAQTDDAALFESSEIKTTKPAKDVEAAIATALRDGQPSFNVTSDTSPEPETYSIQAVQEFNTALATSAGRRQVFIVVGQSKLDETQIFFKVLEYKTEAVNKFSIGNLIGTPVAVNYVPLHSSRVTMTEANQARVAEGVQLIKDRIKQAIGE